MSSATVYHPMAIERTEITIDRALDVTTCQTCHKTMTPTIVRTRFLGFRYSPALEEFVPRSLKKCRWCNTLIADPPKVIRKKRNALRQQNRSKSE